MTHMSVTISRRGFLAAAGTAGIATTFGGTRATAAVRRRSVGANDRIRIGVIGCGDRGINVEMASVNTSAKTENLEVTAVCDVWSEAREKAAAKAKDWFGTDVKRCRTHEELLELEDVDAVFIATSDHWHAEILEAAVKAGKHVYVEKPMAIEMDELNRAYDAAKTAGVVIQVGTQLRSTANAGGCRELVRSGALGRLSRIEQVRNGEKPYWYHYLKPDVKAADVDWKRFAKGRTKKPFDPIRFSGWYGYWEFSQGPVPQLGVHFLDLMHFVTGLGMPESCVCVGGTYTWKDEHGFTAPDQMQALWHYPEGVMVSYLSNFGNSTGDCLRFSGDKGTLEMGTLWGQPTCSAKGAPRRDGSLRGENKVAPVEQTDHWVDWFRCMRSGKLPNAPLESGYQHSVASIMATVSYEKGRKVTFDQARRKLVY